MARIAIDFGTSNTIIARLNAATGEAETIEIPGITVEMQHREHGGAASHTVYAIPSIIHYGEGETLIGAQVLDRGLDAHRYTLRWMKRGVARGTLAKRHTPQGSRTPAEAAGDFLSSVLNYISNRVSFAEDEFTFTVPVEAFEDFQDWLTGVADSLGIRRVRILDEPTAAALGYQESLHTDDRFLMFDFGGGTLDVLIARMESPGSGLARALQLGKAGEELGGMNVDNWIADDFLTRHGITGADRSELLPTAQRRAEAVKIELSDPDADIGLLSIEHDSGSSVRLLRTSYRKDCRSCLRGKADIHGWQDPREACLGCLLLQKGFARDVRKTVENALENATLKMGFQRSHLTRVIVTGGTSQMPGVGAILEEMFGQIVVMDRPFDAVARGATREDDGSMVLLHDYAVEGYNPDRDCYDFVPLFKVGEDYPTEKPVSFSVKCTHNGMRKITLKIYEVSRLKRRQDEVDFRRDIRTQSVVDTDRQFICLNAQAPTFIVVDPPFDEKRDEGRITARFSVDTNRRLLVTVVDTMHSEPLLKEYPVVKL